MCIYRGIYAMCRDRYERVELTLRSQACQASHVDAYIDVYCCIRTSIRRIWCIVYDDTTPTTEEKTSIYIRKIYAIYGHLIY